MHEQQSLGMQAGLVCTSVYRCKLTWGFYPRRLLACRTHQFLHLYCQVFAAAPDLLVWRYMVPDSSALLRSTMVTAVPESTPKVLAVHNGCNFGQPKRRHMAAAYLVMLLAVTRTHPPVTGSTMRKVADVPAHQYPQLFPEGF